MAVLETEYNQVSTVFLALSSEALSVVITSPELFLPVNVICPNFS